MVRAALLALALTSCSWVLDPDELAATRADGASDIVGGDGDATAETPGPDIVVEHSGMGACTFDWARNIAQCPVTCPSSGWTYVVDASRSSGVGSFAWTFEVSGGYGLDKSQASGARVELTISMPDCLLGGDDVRPFSILARLSADGGPFNLIDLPAIGVGFVNLCQDEGTCPDP